MTLYFTTLKTICPGILLKDNMLKVDKARYFIVCIFHSMSNMCSSVSNVFRFMFGIIYHGNSKSRFISSNAILIPYCVYMVTIFIVIVTSICYVRHITCSIFGDFIYLDMIFTKESFQLHTKFSFPLLCANDLRSFLLMMRTRSFLLSCT